MLPDWPDTKVFIARYVNRQLRRETKRRAGLHEVSTHTMREGNKSEITRAADNKEEILINNASSEIEFKHSDLENSSIDEIIQKFDPLIDDMAAQMAKVFFDSISDAANRVGNTVRGAGRPLTAELMLTAFETVHIDFEAGQPRWPTMTASQHQTERIKGELRRLFEEPELAQRMQRLTEQKRAEWRDREANRVLVG